MVVSTSSANHARNLLWARRAVMPEQLFGPRVALTRHRVSDAEAVLAALDESRETLNRWLPSISRYRALDEVRGVMARLDHSWETGQRMTFAVRDRWSGRLLGETGLYTIDWRRGAAEVGYWLRDSAVGHGFMAEALGAMSRAAFANLGLRRLEALIPPHNTRSQETAEHVGFVLSGHMPARVGRDPVGIPEMWLWVLDEPTGVRPPDIALRPAASTDAAAIVNIRVASWCWAYQGILPASYLDTLPASAERRTAWWASQIGRPAEGVGIWVAEDDGEVVGYLAYGPSRDADTPCGEPEIYEFYVRPDLAGAGVGRVLIAHAEAELARSGAEASTLWVFERNARGRRFYRSAGWIEDGAYKLDDVWGRPVAEVRMRKRLSPRPARY